MWVGSALCSPAPIFPGSYVPRSYIPRYLCSPVLSSPEPIFPGSYVPPNFACPVFPGSYVPQYLCSPRNNSTCPIFPSPYVPGVLCSPGPIFPGCFVRRVLYRRILDIYGRHCHIRYELVTTMYGGLALNERLNEPYIVGTSEYIWYFTFTHNVFYTLNMTLR